LFDAYDDAIASARERHWPPRSLDVEQVVADTYMQVVM